MALSKLKGLFPFVSRGPGADFHPVCGDSSAARSGAAIFQPVWLAPSILSAAGDDVFSDRPQRFGLGIKYVEGAQGFRDQAGGPGFGCC